MPKPLMPLWSPEQLAEHCNVPIKSVYAWNHKGTGPKFRKIGRHVRYDPADIASWLDAQQTGGRAA